MNREEAIRRSVKLAACLLFALGGVQGVQATTYVYVSNAEDGDIATFQMDEQTGRLTGGERVKAAPLVMPMSVNPDGKHLYAAVRSKPYRVFSYEIDPSNGRLLSPVVAPLPESMPYISTDRTGRYLFGASYGGNVVSVSRIGADGSIREGASQVIPTGRNAHSIGVDRSNRFAFAAMLGSDQMMQWTFDATSGWLNSNTPSLAQMRAPTGPRHFVVSPDNRFVYVLNELVASVTTFALDAQTGLLQERSDASALPPGTTLQPGAPRGAVGSQSANAPAPRDLDHEIWAADLHLTPDGRFLYATERTSSTLATFRVDPETGRLAYQESIPTEAQPRGFAIDPRGEFVVVAGERSSTLSVYRIHPQTGKLTRQGQYSGGKGANWIEIVRLL